MATIQIENLKCVGCANTITKGLQSINGVEDLNVNVEASQVGFTLSDQTILSSVKEKLSKMGYPEVGNPNSVLKQAKSFVSCVIGRINN